MKLVCISGPRAAGKEKLKSYLEKVLGLRRIVAHTTRPIRACELPGREHHYVSMARFLVMLEAGKMAVNTEVGRHRYGTTFLELYGDYSDCVVDITPRNARVMRTEVESSGDKALLIFVHAAKMERRERIRLRQPGILEAELDEMLASDPAPAEDLGLYRDFDLVIENPDGCLQATLTSVERMVRQFLYSDIKGEVA